MNDYIDKLAYIHLRDRQVLVTLSKGKDVWYIPGGKREPGESDTQALVREVKEELSVDLEAETIRPYGIFEAQAHGKPAGTIVRMTCYAAEFTGALHASAEIETFDFFPFARKEACSEVDRLIFADLKAKRLLA